MNQIQKTGNKLDANIIYALNYIPFVAIYFFLTEKNPDTQIKMHINYGLIITGIYLIYLAFGFTIFRSGAYFLITLLFLGFCGFLAFKAYSKNPLRISFFDDLISKISKK